MFKLQTMLIQNSEKPVPTNFSLFLKNLCFIGSFRAQFPQEPMDELPVELVLE